MQDSMKKIVLGSTTLLAMGAIGASNQADAASANVNIQAIVLDPIQITPVDTLNFGSLTVGAGGGTVVIDNGGFNTVTGDVVSVATSTRQPGTFTLKGSTGRNINIDVANTATITANAGADSMTVNTFVLYNPAGTITGDPITVTLGAATVTGFELGGTLNVGGGQNAGTYTGTVAVTAIYP